MENMVKFTIRHREGVNQAMRIIFEGREFDIIAVDHVNYEGRYMVIRAREAGLIYGGD
jgi:SPP1 family predicted phage head-tail adaptor